MLWYLRTTVNTMVRYWQNSFMLYLFMDLKYILKSIEIISYQTDCEVTIIIWRVKHSIYQNEW